VNAAGPSTARRNQRVYSELAPLPEEYNSMAENAGEPNGTRKGEEEGLQLTEYGRETWSSLLVCRTDVHRPLRGEYAKGRPESE
jgi:hypothetical protein